ncbi:ABC transporter permease, partial [Acidobacteriota bacterium]
LSKVLVSFQFIVSIFLIITTLTVVRQLRYMQDKELGIDYDRTLTFTLRGNNFAGEPENRLKSKRAFKQRLLSDPSILGVTFVSQLPGKITNTGSVYYKNEEELIPLKAITADPDFIEIMGIQLKAGRNLSYEMSTDLGQNVLLNEEAVRQLGINDPVGKTYSPGRVTIVGVVADFHFNSLHTRIEPVAIRWRHWTNRACIKIAGSNVSATIKKIETIFSEFCPGFALEYEFLDESFARQYQAEQQLEKILTYFVILAIGLSCLGLFALTAFMAQRKIKEIGIRKVLGSTNTGIVVLLSRNFAQWILLANVVSWPIAYLVLQAWLQGFAYHISVGPMVFIISGVLALGIAFLTIGYQALKAASSNPADCLRYE